MNYWLFKSEPDAFSIDDLAALPGKRDHWDGIRNYQARNIMRDQMKKGDLGFFYHSSCKVPGVVGIVEIVKESYTDHTQFDPKDPHYDPKSSKSDPRWSMVDVKYVRDLKRYIPLPELKELHLKHKSSKGPLANLALFTKARLSVQPLTKEEFDFILQLEKKEEK